MIRIAEENESILQLELDFVEGNTRARALYEKMGFKRVGTRPGYYAKGSEDAVLMDKELGSIEIDIIID